MLTGNTPEVDVTPAAPGEGSRWGQTYEDGDGRVFRWFTPAHDPTRKHQRPARWVGVSGVDAQEPEPQQQPEPPAVKTTRIVKGQYRLECGDFAYRAFVGQTWDGRPCWVVREINREYETETTRPTLGHCKRSVQDWVAKAVRLNRRPVVTEGAAD